MQPDKTTMFKLFLAYVCLWFIQHIYNDEGVCFMTKFSRCLLLFDERPEGYCVLVKGTQNLRQPYEDYNV